MFWRLNRADFNKMKGEDRKSVLQELTSKNEVAGVLAYVDGSQLAGVPLAHEKNMPRLKTLEF